MISHERIKSSLDEFLAVRGIERNNFHLSEKSILLQKIISMKRNQKNKNYNYSNLPLNNDYMNQIPKRKMVKNKLVKKSNKYNIFNNIINNQKKNTIYNNYISNFGNNPRNNKINKIEDNNKNDNLTINCNYFTETFKSGNEKYEKEYVFHTSTKPLDASNESILNRINRTSNDKSNNYNNQDAYNFFKTPFKQTINKFKGIIHRPDKKFIYKKKIQANIFKEKPKLSRNKISLFYTANHTKENSICNSIDFSIINRTSMHNRNYALSKTTENFFILSTNKKNNKKFLNKNQIHSRNIKFLNHFIKYCYLYYIIIIKKFFNNLKRMRIEYFPNISNLISESKKNNMFEEFNNDDFDRETIKNKTADNFYDGNNLSFITVNKSNKKGLVYNRNNRIINQNYQNKKLMDLLNNSYIENDKNIQVYENKRFTFDNEKENTDLERSPFFNEKNAQNNFSENDNIISSKGKIKSNNSDNKDNIIGFIQINNEINPFKIKNNNINFFNESVKNQQQEDEILSFRKKNSERNKNKSNPIINILNLKTLDNKLNINIKYFPDSYFPQNSKIFNNNELNQENFCFKLSNNNDMNNKRIKKISLRVKNSKIIKEKEDYVDLSNNENRKKYLYSLSIIKEEDDEKYINDSSFKKPFPFKKLEPYYNISNNSKLISKASIEKLIDGDKIINEEDIDQILSKSSSRYKNYDKKSQEIVIVSNFNSIMRNRINRKENAKALINGILILIEFFGSLCFNIRKNTFEKFKMSWKLSKMRTSIVKYIFMIFIKKSEEID